jgi:hypothetical protein
MTDVTKIYPSGTVFQLLLKNPEATSIVNEWLEMNRQADLRIRRAKTPGHVVIETTEALFASHVIQWWPHVKVNVKEPTRANSASQGERLTAGAMEERKTS